MPFGPWGILPDCTEEQNARERDDSCQAQTPDDEWGDAPLKKKYQGYGGASYLNLAENQAENGSRSGRGSVAF